MAKSTDQRIKNILQKKAKEKEAAEQAKKQAQERSNERQATAENVGEKWSADTHIIAEILKDFEQKMSALGLQLAFQDEGQKGDALAEGDASSAAFPEVTYKLRSTSILPAKYTPFRVRKLGILRFNLPAILSSQC